jgi:hypothetical protein
MHSKSLYIVFFISLLLTLICFSEGCAQTDCDSLRQQLLQVRKEFAEIESRWNALPPGKEKERLEAQLHKLDDRRLIIKKKLRDAGCTSMPYWVIAAILIAIASIIVALIKLLRKRRQLWLPLPRQPAPGPDGDSPTPLTIDRAVLAAFITAGGSIIAALIGLLRNC